MFHPYLKEGRTTQMASWVLDAPRWALVEVQSRAERPTKAEHRIYA